MEHSVSMPSHFCSLSPMSIVIWLTGVVVHGNGEELNGKPTNAAVKSFMNGLYVSLKLASGKTTGVG